MEAKHAATPWRVFNNGSPDSVDIDADDNGLIVTVATVGKANAEFIVRACNAHDELVKALKLTLSGLESGSVKSTPILDFSDENADSLPMVSLASVIRAALAKAGVSHDHQ